MGAALLALVALGAAPLSSCEGARPREAAPYVVDTTDPPRFAPPRWIAAGPTMIDRRPALAVRGSDVFIAAGLGFRDPARRPSPAAGDTANLLLAPDGAVPSRPAGSFGFRMPRAAFDAHGVLHLVWGEAAASTGEEPSMPRIGSLWHARLAAGRWTAPVRIYEAQEIVWDPGASSSLVADARGGLHLAAPAWKADGGWVLAYLTSSGGEWTAADVHPAAPAAYVDLAAAPSGQLAIVYAAGYSRGRESHTNALFSVVSADGGATWGAHTLFGGPERWPAAGVRAAYGRDGALHVIWMQRAPGAMDVQALWHARSRDGGRTWNDFASASMAGRYGSPQVAVSRSGRVHAVTTWYHERRADLIYVRYGDGRWTDPRPLFPRRLGAEPNLRIDEWDRLHLLWIAQPEGVAVPLDPSPGDTIPWFDMAYSTAETARR